MGSRINRLLFYIHEISWIKTLRLNFHYLHIKDAIKLPILVSRHLRIKSMNGSVKIRKKISTGLIRLGFDTVGIFDNKKSRSIWELSDGEIEFFGKAEFGNGFKISVGNGGKLLFGDNFHLNAESTIICYKQITFGKNCLLSWDILIMDTDFHHIYDNEGNIINSPRPISIGDNVWIGCRNLVLKGSEIPSGSVVGANSTVTRKFTDGDSIYFGNPAKIIKRNIYWKD